MQNTPLVSKITALLLDATNLNPTLSPQDISALGSWADPIGANICIQPQFVKTARQQFPNLIIATVIGFPTQKRWYEEAKTKFGDVPTQLKIGQIKEAIENGADEVDVVMNVPLFLKESSAATLKPRGFDESNACAETKAEFRTIRKAAKRDGKNIPIKLIISSELLTQKEIEKATQLCIEAGFEMVKTSTGMTTFSEGNPDQVIFRERKHTLLEEVKWIANTIANFNCPSDREPMIKASGGIKTFEDVQKLVAAGQGRLARIGTSSYEDIYAAAPDS